MAGGRTFLNSLDSKFHLFGQKGGAQNWLAIQKIEKIFYSSSLKTRTPFGRPNSSSWEKRDLFSLRFSRSEEPLLLVKIFLPIFLYARFINIQFIAFL